MGSPVKRHATYEDVLNAPAHLVAEIVDGDLHLSPRPAGPHTSVVSTLSGELGPPFRRGRAGAGGWIVLYEPELHLGKDVLVPDLGGWRRERMPAVPNVPFFTLAPDWVCEVASPSTEKLDRAQKLPVYARAGVKHAWLVDPLKRTLEGFRLEGERWLLLGVYKDDDKIRLEPFDAIELDLSVLWADLAP
jgi:Uma2 family endonuclease